MDISIKQQVLCSNNKKTSFQGNTTSPSLMMRPVVSICKLAGNNPALAEAVIGTIFASALRPVTIMAVPGAKKEDKEYAAGKAFISGLLYLTTSIALYTPIAFAISKLSHDGISRFAKSKTGQKIVKTCILPFAEKSKETKAFKFITKYGMSFPIGAMDAFILFKLIPPVVSKLFKHNKPNPENKKEVK